MTRAAAAIFSNAWNRSVFLAGCLLVLSQFVLSPYYLTNDDVQMRMIAEGSYSPVYGPSPFLGYVNILYGEALVALYRVFPSIHWYDAFLLGIVVVAAVAILRAMQTRRSAAADLVVPAAFALVYLLVFFVRIQFTLVATLVAASGFLIACRLATIRPQSRIEWIAGLAYVVASLAIAGLVRVESLIGATLLAVPAGVPLVLTAPRRRSQAAVAGALVMGLTFAVLGQWIHERSFQDAEGFSAFLEYEQAAREIAEYRDLTALSEEELESQLSEVGWSLVDFMMFASYFHTDPEIFGLERVLAVRDALREGGASLADEKIELVDVASSVIRNYQHVQSYILFMLLLSLPFRSKRCFGYAVAMVVLLMATLVAIDLFRKEPPFRVYLGFCALLSGFVVLGGIQWGRSPATWLHRHQVLGVLAFVALTLFAPEVAQSTVNVKQREILAQDIVAFGQKKGEVLVIWGGHMEFERWLAPFRSLDPALRLSFISADVWNQTELVQNTIRYYGFGKLERALCTRDDLKMVASKRLARLLVSFVQQHYDLDVRRREVFRGKRLLVFECEVR